MDRQSALGLAAMVPAALTAKPAAACSISNREKVFVAVNEQPASGIGPICPGMPTLHLFLVGYQMGQPRQIEHVGSGIWSGYGQVGSWAGR